MTLSRFLLGLRRYRGDFVLNDDSQIVPQPSMQELSADDQRRLYVAATVEHPGDDGVWCLRMTLLRVLGLLGGPEPLYDRAKLPRPERDNPHSVRQEMRREPNDLTYGWED